MSERSPAVLVVEDEKQIRQFVRTALEQEGCRVYEAGTSAQGLIEAGLVNASWKIVGAIAARVRQLQTGYLYHYALSMIAGLLLLMTWFVWIL